MEQDFRVELQAIGEEFHFAPVAAGELDEEAGSAGDGPHGASEGADAG